MPTRKLRELESRLISSYAPAPADLAVFRMLYATFTLLSSIPRSLWIVRAPAEFFYPPVGLPSLTVAVPPAEVVLGMNVILVLFSSMLLVGYWTELASVGTGLSLMMLNAWGCSLGKIDHNILEVVTPLVLSLSAWGRTLSVDAGRRPAAVARRIEAWPLALLALLVGYAMFTAGWAKATTGWFDPARQCTYGHLVTNYFVTGRETWFGAAAMRIESPVFWKMADWSAVLLELALLPAACHRRLFVPLLAITCIFHLGVLFLFDISFPSNVTTYGAFVRYSAMAPIPDGVAIPRRVAVGLSVASIAVGLTAVACGESITTLIGIELGRLVVWLGAAGGTAYLVVTAVASLTVVSWPRGNRSGIS